MSILIKDPIVLATEQTIKLDEIHVTGGGIDSWQATVSFVVLNQNGERVGYKYLSYSGEEFDKFWQGFDSVKFLYEELAKQESYTVKIEDQQEDQLKEI